ncbi:MAG: hypothetical protein KBD56_08795 [Candidatus Eisenbacteria bacterium]|nr:hypothetical protein [Candidatus Eisenbacteria bacterium]
MIRALLLSALVAVSMAGAVSAETNQHWLHVRVDESGPDGETVRINFPMELVTEMLPLIEAEGHDGFQMTLGGNEKKVDVAQIVRALRKGRDGEYVTVESDEETVRVTKKEDYLLVHVDEKDEKVDIRLRLAVVDALLSGEDGELNFKAAAAALEQEGECELVRVESEDENVLIWIDSRDSID